MNQNAIKDFMTPQPHCIEPNESLRQAIARMRDYGIKHLPVRANKKIVGIVSERDLDFALRYVDVDSSVSSVMISDPYCVRPDLPLTDVAANMIEKHIGSSIVTDERDEVLGIFTYVDALRAIVTGLRK